MNIDEIKIRAAARDIVDRSAYGDQNAMAMLHAVRENRSENASARIAYDEALKYSKRQGEEKKHDWSTMGAEEMGALRTLNQYGPLVARIEFYAIPNISQTMAEAGTVILANRAPVNAQLVNALADDITDEDAAEAFLQSVGRDVMALYRKLEGAPLAVRQICNAGQMLAMAARLQSIRRVGTPLAVYAPEVASELGERPVALSRPPPPPSPSYESPDE